MARKKIQRTPAELEEMKEARREKNKIYQRKYRLSQKIKKLTANTPDTTTSVASCSHSYTNIVIDIDTKITDPTDSCDHSPFNNRNDNVTDIPSTSHGTSNLELPRSSNCYSTSEYNGSSDPKSTQSGINFIDHDDNIIIDELSDSENMTNHNNYQNSMTDLNSIPSTSHTLPLNSNQVQNSCFEHNYCRSSLPSEASLGNQYFTEHNYSRTADGSSYDETFDNDQLASNNNQSRLNINNDFDEEMILENHIGAMNVICRYCNAKHFTDEIVSNKTNSFNDCCRHGEVSLETQPEFPPLLKSLFTGTHEVK